ncbi:MAG TPA: ISKra4 family transposase, partial [Candidatus Acidoferrum sp.]|nr:ISKra4 family transposase [Candidatus Acidoferrum sp.]
RPQPNPNTEGALLVSSADGKGIVMRREEGEAAPPTHRTKGDKASQKRMAIVGAVYTVDPYERTAEEVVAALFGEHQDKPPRRPAPCHKRVWASLSYEDEDGENHSGIEEVYGWLQGEVLERNGKGTKPMIHIGDGQETLWEARAAYLPDGNLTEILDLLHVTPRLWQAAHLFSGEKSREAEVFVRERLLRILQGQGEGVIRGLREMGTKRGLKGQKKKKLKVICGYLEKNRERMRYDEYLEKGYPIASGVIEGACRHLVKDRMERAGMHWTVRGAQAMLDVRSTCLNGDWEEYQAYRIEEETKRLYPWRSLVEGPQFDLAV